MNRNKLKKVAVIAFGTALWLSAAADEASKRIAFNIELKTIARALTDLGEQAGLQILVRADDARTRQVLAEPIRGEFTVEAAIEKVLANTGLTYDFVDDRTVRVRLVEAPSGENTTEQESAGPLALAQNTTRDREAGVGASHDGAAQSPDPSMDIPLQEVLVTAQKRKERLHDVPVPVTAISGGALLERNQLRLQDFYANIPGLNLVSSSKGDAFISIRGVTTGATSGNPTVGITIDDVQYGPSSTYGAGGLGVPAPDIDPSDLAQIEVLRGPQGTLYGASSIGGLLKYVTVDPSLTKLAGRVQAGMSSVEKASQAGYTFRGNVNIPLTETIAVRAGGFDRRDPGYIDDPTRGIEGVNTVDVRGGRLSSLWRPSEIFSLKLSALLQDTRGDGAPDVDIGTGLGDLEQNRLRGTGAYRKKAQLYHAVATARLGATELTSLSGYGLNTDESTIDFSPAFGDFALNGVPGTGFAGFGVPGASLVNDFETRKFSQELRLSAVSGERVGWLLGLLYTRERSRVSQQINGVDAANGAVAGQFLDAEWPTTYTEYAAFANLTFQLTDRFDIQLGGRESQNRQTYSEIDAGIYGPVFFGLPDPIVNPEVRTKDNSFTYLVTPRFKMTPDSMVYARLASGYRAGGPNPTSTVFNLPPQFGPDTTRNYEIGTKVALFGGLLSIDASVYYIDWQDIQLNVFDPVSFATYFVNGSRAKSQGIELAVESSPIQGLKLSAWASYNDARLTEAFPDTATLFGVSGDRLPNSAKISGHLAIDHELALRGDLMANYGASIEYIGDRKGAFVSVAGPPERQEFPSYSQVSLRAGLGREPWSANLFVTNLTDERGLIAGGLGTFNPFAFTYIQPRTVGVTLSWDF